MGIILKSPASLMDLAKYSGADSAIKWAVAREMWDKGETFILKKNDEVLVLAGLYPFGDEAHEGWLNLQPEAKNNMIIIIKYIRLTLLSHPYGEIIIICTSEAGKRIARLCGFSFKANTNNGELWSYG